MLGALLLRAGLDNLVVNKQQQNNDNLLSPRYVPEMVRNSRALCDLYLTTTYEAVFLIISISQMRNLRQREVQEVHKVIPAGRILTQICLILESLLLTILS